MKRAIFIFLFLAIGALFFMGVKKFSGNDVLPNLSAGLIVLKSNPEPREEIEPPKELSLLGKAEISFAGSSVDRAHNIALGLSKLNGYVVPVGEEFSFTKAIGVVSADEGYRDEKSFLNGEVVYGAGGGLCQVSTTLFQSILSAGLPVTERYNHTFTVPYYKVGLDATYSNPGPDLKFVNDTSGPLRIEGRVENQKAIFEIYGVADGRISTVSEAEIYNRSKVPNVLYFYDPTLPFGEEKCEQRSQSGYSTKVKYNVLYSDNTNKEQIFHSVYRPLARVCRTNNPAHFPFAIVR